jgi:mono/diheme cytochrome c family protein
MTRLIVAVITMVMTTAACAEETPERTKPKTAGDGGAKVEAQKPTADAVATKPTVVAEEKKAEAGAEKSAAGSEKAGGGEKAAGGGGAAPYKVSEDGKKVDEKTYAGYGTYTNVCVPCHGRDATGGMGGGANLVESLKKLSEEEAKQIILDGKPGTLMAGFKTDPGVAKNVDGIYAYLKGRSDGKIWGKSLEKLQ